MVGKNILETLIPGFLFTSTTSKPPIQFVSILGVLCLTSLKQNLAFEVFTMIHFQILEAMGFLYKGVLYY